MTRLFRCYTFTNYLTRFKIRKIPHDTEKLPHSERVQRTKSALDPRDCERLKALVRKSRTNTEITPSQKGDLHDNATFNYTIMSIMTAIGFKVLFIRNSLHCVLVGTRICQKFVAFLNHVLDETAVKLKNQVRHTVSFFKHYYY